MKHMKRLLTAWLMLMLIVACGGGNDGDNGGGEETAAGKTFSQSVTLPATGAEKVVELTGLTAEISSITGAAAWLTVLKNGETANSVKLVATDNDGVESRRCVVSIADKAENTVALTVTQEMNESLIEVDIDKSHDLPTDQPAYSR